MPQQGNESSATPRPWKIYHGDKSLDLCDASGNLICSVPECSQGHADARFIVFGANTYDENQATIKDLQERLEKQGKVIKDLIEVANNAHLLLTENFLGNKFAAMHLREVLNSILKDLQP